MTDTATEPLLQYTPGAEPGRARLHVETAQVREETVSPLLLGKFCEHLGANIYQGMEAQILHNPTMGRWRFGAAEGHPDGGVREEGDVERIRQRITAYAAAQGWPAPDPVIQSYLDGGAFGWFRIGAPDRVVLGADVDPHGGRAQRVQVEPGTGSAGLGQWCFLPQHRVQEYLLRMVARAPGSAVVKVELALERERTDSVDGGDPAGGGAGSGNNRARFELGDGWDTVTASFTVSAGCRRDTLYRLAITTEGPAHLQIDRVLLYPADHVGGADPDVIARLREARLPLLRWPGGNFVSGYHWRDGVGPVDARPTRPNPAWDGIEPNLFGTDEFMAFCQAVGCEPMICVNAGDGTPAEAADWVEYCNGSRDTPMGGLRAAHGHPEPYGVRYWEIGNEVYGRWQVGWTTREGNADRYRRFREAMLAVDPHLRLIGCGHGNEPLSPWNDHLIRTAGNTLRCISDHILTGGTVDPGTDPVDLFHAFMGYPQVLEERYAALRRRMADAGIHAPHLAITELQLFAHYRSRPAGPQAPPCGGLTPEQMPTPDTLAEALYLAGILHTCIRLGDFVELLTHSATVNHGGGLRKVRQRVYANPVHHAHVLADALAGGSPVPVRLSCPAFSTRRAFGHIPPLTDVPCLDPMAVLLPSGQLVLMVVHRGAQCGSLDLSVRVAGYRAAATARVTRLAGEHWWDRNIPEQPERVTPVDTEVPLEEDGELRLALPPFSLTRVVLERS